MKKFEVKKSYEEVDIEGDIYRIDLSDNKLKEHILEGHNLKEKADEILNMPSGSSVEQIEQGLEEVKAVTKDATDNLLGEGAFDVIYPKTGESVNVMADTLFQVIDYLNEKREKDNESKKAKYTKKKKK
ncbi:hypothetical protein J2Z83_003729 [Virgibacillus natechei]|uniref:Phage protein n=1 Tax=Virgibacillus natechei TaxID=1216297 RepID=A0ABS4IKU7_9BACI|nr:hypothetical protein [Virgibacillus natechei]MBP1971578.1 hypothetical protein [Virgibacillus natechei]UZD13088.1 hypothetical protein OLD84_00475 [Virgibacillus natechei]